MNNQRVQKSGREIKAAVAYRLGQLQRQIERRNRAIDALVQDPHKMRDCRLDPGLLLRGQEEFTPSERAQIAELCRRITALEDEMERLARFQDGLAAEQVYHLTTAEASDYGFAVPGV